MTCGALRSTGIARSGGVLVGVGVASWTLRAFQGPGSRIRPCLACLARSRRFRVMVNCSLGAGKAAYGARASVTACGAFCARGGRVAIRVRCARGTHATPGRTRRRELSSRALRGARIARSGRVAIFVDVTSWARSTFCHASRCVSARPASSAVSGRLRIQIRLASRALCTAGAALVCVCAWLAGNTWRAGVAICVSCSSWAG